MELFAADGHDAGGCERVTGKSGMRPSAKITGVLLKPSLNVILTSPSLGPIIPSSVNSSADRFRPD